MTKMGVVKSMGSCWRENSHYTDGQMMTGHHASVNLPGQSSKVMDRGGITYLKILSKIIPPKL